MRLHADGHVARALTIAGSDSGGGAGIQADLKTMQQFGVYGMSVITALTAQNTLGVQGVMEVQPEFVRQQLNSVLDDLGADAVKTGMLASEAIIHALADCLDERPLPHLVIDPVMVAKGGAPLIAPSAVNALRTRLLAHAEVVTPNIPEASTFLGCHLATWDAYHRAARDLAESGVKSVVIKGGHMASERGADPLAASQQWRRHLPGRSAIDIVFTASDATFTYFVTPRVDSLKTHGTGCTFSAAITSMLARKAPLLDAIGTAKAFTYRAIEGSKQWVVGYGHGPTDHSVAVPEVSSFEPGGAYLFNGETWTQVNG